MAQSATNGQTWDLAADVVVIGSGAAGLPAAIKAADGGASVIVVETNYDIGGHAIISGGNVPLGGGTSAQKKYGIQDSPDTVFSDLTDWTIVQANGWPDFRYNDREVMRAFADHCALTYEFLLESGVQFKEVPPDNQGGHNLGNSAPRENHVSLCRLDNLRTQGYFGSGKTKTPWRKRHTALRLGLILRNAPSANVPARAALSGIGSVKNLRLVRRHRLDPIARAIFCPFDTEKP